MQYKKFLLVGVVLIAHTTEAAPRINMYLRNYPLTQDHADKMAHKIQRPEKIAKYQLTHQFDHNSNVGIFLTYAGYLDTSDINGHVMFPRKHNAEKVYLLVTPLLEPEIMFAATVSHWNLIKGYPAQMFVIEKQYEKTTKSYFWQTTEIDLPENNIVPQEAIVIFAKPKNVYVPIGITLSDDRENFTLPDIYMKKGTNVMENALNLLSIAHLFRPIDIIYQRTDNRYQNHLIG